MKPLLPTIALLLVLPGLPGLPACGHTGGDAGEPKATTPQNSETPKNEAKRSEVCGSQTCTIPERCIEFVGIGGPRVPLSTCGIPCKVDSQRGACPDGMTCIRIPDGPTRCEPNAQSEAVDRHALPDTAPNIH